MRRKGTALVPGADCTGMASMVSSVQMTIWDAAIGGKEGVHYVEANVVLSE